MPMLFLCRCVVMTRHCLIVGRFVITFSIPVMILLFFQRNNHYVATSQNCLTPGGVLDRKTNSEEYPAACQFCPIRIRPHECVRIILGRNQNVTHDSAPTNLLYNPFLGGNRHGNPKVIILALLRTIPTTPQNQAKNKENSEPFAEAI
jgi:hypothetical protein